MKTYPSKKDAYIRFIPFLPAVIIGIVALVNSFNHTPNDWSMIFIPIVLYIGMSFLIKVTYTINNNELIISNLILKRKLDVLHFYSIRKQNKFIITTEKAGMSKVE